MTVAVVVALWLSHLDRGSAHRSPRTVVFATRSSQPAGSGPSGRQDGVAIGWPHDAAGATDAATSDVAATGLVVEAGPLARADVIDVFASPSFATALTARTDRQLDDLAFSLGQAGSDPTAITWVEYPLTVQAHSEGTDRDSVRVWSVAIVSIPGQTGVAREEWRTSTLTMVWEAGDWKVAGWDSAPGPSPAPVAPSDPSAVTAVAAVTGWARTTGGR